MSRWSTRAAVLLLAAACIGASAHLHSCPSLQEDIVQRRVDLMAAEGVRFVTSAHVGKVRGGNNCVTCCAWCLACCSLGWLCAVPACCHAPGEVSRHS